eukprot:scaffold3853_cov60-Phaeocystis_antarctica.AAC.2
MLGEVRALRQCAQHRQLDLTDSFEEYAGTGRDANLGVMAKNRFRGAMGTCYMHMHMFRGAMGTLFQGINLSSYTLNKICAVYNAGDPDPKEPGTCMKASIHPSIHPSIYYPPTHPSNHPSTSPRCTGSSSPSTSTTSLCPPAPKRPTPRPRYGRPCRRWPQP